MLSNFLIDVSDILGSDEDTNQTKVTCPRGMKIPPYEDEIAITTQPPTLPTGAPGATGPMGPQVTKPNPDLFLHINSSLLLLREFSHTLIFFSIFFLTK